MRTLLTSTCLTAIALAALPAAASAQVSIGTATTTPVRTSTASNGNPSDVNVTADGSITLNSGAAITVDSNNSVTNAGKLVMGSADGASGITVNSGTSGTITNSGTITVFETFNAPNPDGNSIVDGPIAQANDRAGIRVMGGGTHTGNIVSSGTITVEGLNSAGIRVDDALAGSLTHSGTIGVRGDNSVGIKTGSVSGNVVVGGKVSVVGAGAVALNVGGDVGGAVVINNVVQQQSSYTDDNGSNMTLARPDLRTGAPAVVISGNVGKGILVAAKPTVSSSNKDTDGDGVDDSLEAGGAIQSFGNGPALAVGGAGNTTIGAVTGNTHGLVIGGSVQANAYYSSTDATAVQIGGLGGAVNVVGGIQVSGTIKATTVDAGATALLINAGSNVPVLDNSGTISAIISSPGEGSAYGVRDLSGTLTTINNSGFISAGGTARDQTAAIDLSANTTGVTISQTAPSGADTSASTQTLAAITGNIFTGSGNDVIKASGGSIIGNAVLGDGNDSILLSGDAAYRGQANFGNGTATLGLADKSQFVGTAVFNGQPATINLAGTALFSGQITGGDNLVVNVAGGTLQASGTQDLNFNTLNVGKGGTIKVAIDGTNHTSPKFNVTTATFEQGAHVAASINSLSNVEGDYTILTAQQITGTPSFDATQTDLPFLFKGAVSINQSAGTINLNIARKSAGELGLNRSQAAAYSAILAAAPADAGIENSLLQAGDADTLHSQFSDLLPDHAGGNFDVLVRGSRQATRHLTNNNAMFNVSGVGGWFEALKWSGNRDTGNTAAYKTDGWGLSGGLEKVTGIGNVGVSIDWMSGKNKTKSGNSAIDVNNYEFGAFWRKSMGPFYAFARASYSIASFKSNRNFQGTVNGQSLVRTATADWNGHMYSGSAGISYQFDLSDRVGIKPMAIFDYYRLHEDGYTEVGGGDAMNLTVAARNSDTAAALTTITGIYRFGNRTAEGIPLTLELEGGRRNDLGGSAGTTLANFKDGDSFSLMGDKMGGGWVGEARLLSGGLDYTWTLAGNVQQDENAKPSWGARISFGVAF